MRTGSNGAAPDISHLNCSYSEKSFVCVRSICVIISALCTSVDYLASSDT